MSAHTNGGRRLPGQLQSDILAILRSANHPVTVAAITGQVGGTSEGAVDQALKKLIGAGYVEMDDSSRPRQFRLAFAATSTGTSTSTSTSASAGASASPMAAPVARPNGSLYYPRRLAGSTDVDVLRQLRDADIAVLLFGPPGTGKTSLAEAAYSDVITVAGDGDTTVADLVGEYAQNPDGTYTFVDGPLVVAMQEGRALFIDDITLIAPPVLAALYPAMDGRREITVKANKNTTVTAAAGFYVLGAHNPGVHGAILSEALASRFSLHIGIDTDYDLATQLNVPRVAIKIARNLATQRDSGAIGWSPQMRELLAYRDITAQLGPDIAAANLAAVAPDIDRATVSEVISRITGSAVTPLRLGTRATTTTTK